MKDIIQADQMNSIAERDLLSGPENGERARMRKNSSLRPEDLVDEYLRNGIWRG